MSASNSAMAGLQAAALVQEAMHEGRTIEAACLLAHWVQIQEGTPALGQEQQAHLLHSCHDLVLSEMETRTDLWSRARACLYAALLLT
ncbi:hypothetical protein D3Y59_09850 [Hymenobacter oligotrophus]|uniref:Uncharacterized protein n=1 Tax=Hymenobacter oligotrophus TaxID=2319843 RepID=A0A3B7QW52_9BACT|nr:hypothetical protein [Hymenobacter oligotrophus]AYA37328.1 hypothetical protein D3Y59_09850 [Hymenobacter oligotrophus]